MPSPDDPMAGRRVSIVIPVYNGANVIERAVRSVLDQTLPAHEIILVDDGSTDNSFSVLQRLEAEHPTVRVLKLEQNGGVSRARNRGNAIATGDWISILDGDDAFRTDRLERMLDEAIRAEANFVVDNLVLYDLDAQADYRRMFVADWERRPLDQLSYWQNTRFGGPQYSILKPIIRRDFIDSVGLRYDEQCGNGQDLIFQGEALALGARAIVLSEPMYIYSMRRGAISKKDNKESRTQMNFAGIADRMNALAQRHQASIPPDAMAALQTCEDSLRQNQTLNSFRALRRTKPLRALGELAARPAAIGLWFRMRYRSYVVSRPPYTF